jgi:outer membrane lipoprotein-sorting protein
MRFISTALFLAAALVAGPALADAKSEILASHQAMVKAAKFRIESTNESRQGKVENWAEIEWPDRYHMRNAQMEVIVLPGKTYMKQGGQWMPFPMDMSAMIKAMSPEAMKQGFDSMTNVKELGEKTLDGRTVKGYEYDSTVTMMNVTAKSHVQLWVDTATQLPVRQEIDGEAMGMKSRTTQRYTFDPSISIKAPM